MNESYKKNDSPVVYCLHTEDFYNPDSDTYGKFLYRGDDLWRAFEWLCLWENTVKRKIIFAIEDGRKDIKENI